MRGRIIFGFGLLLVTSVSVFAGNNAGGNFSLWPDTGQNLCYDDQGNEIACPTEGEPFYGQDAQYQNPNQSYSPLNGGTMVQDNVTGLIWEVKTTEPGIHYKYDIYNWCDTNPDTNGGHEGTCGGDSDTKNFINTLNNNKFGGYSDWRLPTLKELVTLLDHSRINPSINTALFPNTAPFSYWSSTTHAEVPGGAWYVEFSIGYVQYGPKSGLYVRAVRGGR